MTRRVPVSLLAVLAYAAVTFGARALDPPYLDRFPPVDKVLAENQGKDRLDTNARQVAALHQWGHAIELLAGDRRFLRQTPDEQRLVAEYGTAASKIEKEMVNTLSTRTPSNPFQKSEHGQWLAQSMAYERDAKQRAASFGRYLPPDVVARLGAAYESQGRQLRGESSGPGAFSQLDPATQATAMIGLYVFLGLMALIVVREFLPFGSRQSNPLKIGAGFKVYTVGGAAGSLTNYKTWTVTVTTTSDPDHVVRNKHSSGWLWYHISTYVHESFDLVGSRSTHSVHVVNENLKIPEGHFVTAVWTQDRGGRGTYILFFDRTTGTTRELLYGIGEMLTVRLWILLPVLAVAFVVGGVGVPAFFHGINGLGGALIGMFVGWVLTTGVINLIVNPRRVRRFLKRDVPRISAVIEKQGLVDTTLVTPAA